MIDVLNKQELQPLSLLIVGYLPALQTRALLGLPPLAHLPAKSARCSRKLKPSWLAHISDT